MSPARPDLSAEDILAVLNRRGVRYVVIGAFAAIAHGAPIDATYDIDVTPNRDPQNLQRLSRALSDLDARIRVNDLEEGMPFAHDASSLARMDMLNRIVSAPDQQRIQLRTTITTALRLGDPGARTGPSRTSWHDGTRALLHEGMA